MGVWPVFLPIEMYQDHGNQFAVGDVIAWEVLLVDGEQQDWPTERLVDSTVRIIPRPAWAVRGSLADAGAMRVCWGGPEPVGSVVVLKAGLVADFWNPPIPTTILATIHRIEVVRRKSALTLSGVWMPTGTWSVTSVERTPPLRGVNPNNPGAEHDVGLLFTVEISSSTTRTYDEIGTGVGDLGFGPGITLASTARSPSSSRSVALGAAALVVEASRAPVETSPTASAPLTLPTSAVLAVCPPADGARDPA